MGQLIKLQDYISRYEVDIYKYPAQFIRLKRKQWDELYQRWQSGSLIFPSQEVHQEVPLEIDAKNQPIWEKIKQKFAKNNKEEQTEFESEIDQTSEETPFSIERSWRDQEIPQTVSELKKFFLNHLFEIQLIWASTTFSQKSYVDYSYYKEKNLKYFLQRFPDTFLILYNPIFLLKKAPVEAEIIMLTPMNAYCIAFLEAEDHAVFIGSEEYFWKKIHDQKQENLLNPLIGLNRTETIMNGIWRQDGLEFPLQKLIISRNGYIEYPNVPFGVTIIDQRNYEDWFQTMRKSRSPLKSSQLKAARSLLNYCKTTAVPRTDWN